MGTISQNAGAISTPDFANQATSIAQQRKIAELLRAEVAKQKQPEGTMVSGRWIRPDMSQGLMNSLSQFEAYDADKQATQAEGQYAGQVAEARKNWQSALPQTIAGQDAVPNIEQDPSNMQGPTQEPFQAAQAAVPEQRPTRDAILKHTIAGLAIPGNEAEAKLVGDSLTSGLTRKEDQDYKDIEARFAAAERKAQALEVAGFNQAAQTERNNADNRRAVEVAAMMAAARGGARSDAAAQKAADKKESHDAAVVQASNHLDRMAGLIAGLEKGGAVTSNSQSPLSNALSSGQNSMPGQWLGGVFNTKNQQMRDQMQNLATGLVANLKDLKNLGASQMNSNVELQLYLSAMAGGKNNYSAETLKEINKNARTLLTGVAPAPISDRALAEMGMSRAEMDTAIRESRGLPAPAAGSLPPRPAGWDDTKWNAYLKSQGLAP